MISSVRHEIRKWDIGASEDRFRANDLSLCPSSKKLPPYRPIWNVAEIAKKYVFTSNQNIPYFKGVDDKTDFVVVVRCHAGYARQLLAMIYFFRNLKSIYDLNFLLLVIPTEKDSYNVLAETIHKDKEIYLKSVLRKGKGLRTENLRISLLFIPDIIYNLYGNYLARVLCTSDWKEMRWNQFGKLRISRFCDVNSPLHYLLVDIAVYYVKTYCVKAQQLIVTNADNAYSSLYFDTIWRKTSTADVIMTNMLNKGAFYDVKPLRSRVDLGAYAVNIAFLRDNDDVTFLGILPERAEANDYHDCDGYYIQTLVANGARCWTFNATLYIHH